MYPCSTIWYRSSSVKQVSDLSSLDFVINRLFMKLFKTNNIEIVELCQYQFGFEKPSVLWKKRVSRFNVKFDTSDNAFCNVNSHRYSN